MATIDNKEMIDKIIRQDGFFEDDPQVYMIVEYINAYGNITWGVTWTNERVGALTRYLVETEFVREPKIIWKAKV